MMSLNATDCRFTSSNECLGSLGRSSKQTEESSGCNPRADLCEVVTRRDGTAVEELDGLLQHTLVAMPQLPCSCAASVSSALPICSINNLRNYLPSNEKQGDVDHGACEGNPANLEHAMGGRSASDSRPASEPGARLASQSGHSVLTADNGCSANDTNLDFVQLPDLPPTSNRRLITPSSAEIHSPTQSPLTLHQLSTLVGKLQSDGKMMKCHPSVPCATRPCFSSLQNSLDIIPSSINVAKPDVPILCLAGIEDSYPDSYTLPSEPCNYNPSVPSTPFGNARITRHGYCTNSVAHPILNLGTLPPCLGTAPTPADNLPAKHTCPGVSGHDRCPGFAPVEYEASVNDENPTLETTLDCSSSVCSFCVYDRNCSHFAKISNGGKLFNSCKCPDPTAMSPSSYHPCPSANSNCWPMLFDEHESPYSVTLPDGEELYSKRRSTGQAVFQKPSQVPSNSFARTVIRNGDNDDNCVDVHSYKLARPVPTVIPGLNASKQRPIPDPPRPQCTAGNIQLPAGAPRATAASEILVSATENGFVAPSAGCLAADPGCYRICPIESSETWHKGTGCQATSNFGIATPQGGCGGGVNGVLSCQRTTECIFITRKYFDDHNSDRSDLMNSSNDSIIDNGVSSCGGPDPESKSLAPCKSFGQLASSSANSDLLNAGVPPKTSSSNGDSGSHSRQKLSKNGTRRQTAVSKANGLSPQVIPRSTSSQQTRTAAFSWPNEFLPFVTPPPNKVVCDTWDGGKCLRADGGGPAKPCAVVATQRKSSYNPPNILQQQHNVGVPCGSERVRLPTGNPPINFLPSPCATCADEPLVGVDVLYSTSTQNSTDIGGAFISHPGRGRLKSFSLSNALKKMHPSHGSVGITNNSIGYFYSIPSCVNRHSISAIFPANSDSNNSQSITVMAKGRSLFRSQKGFVNGSKPVCSAVECGSSRVTIDGVGVGLSNTIVCSLATASGGQSGAEGVSSAKPDSSVNRTSTSDPAVGNASCCRCALMLCDTIDKKECSCLISDGLSSDCGITEVPADSHCDSGSTSPSPSCSSSSSLSSSSSCSGRCSRSHCQCRNRRSPLNRHWHNRQHHNSTQHSDSICSQQFRKTNSTKMTQEDHFGDVLQPVHELPLTQSYCITCDNPDDESRHHFLQCELNGNIQSNISSACCMPSRPVSVTKRRPKIATSTTELLSPKDGPAVLRHPQPPPTPMINKTPSKSALPTVLNPVSDSATVKDPCSSSHVTAASAFPPTQSDSSEVSNCKAPAESTATAGGGSISGKRTHPSRPRSNTSFSAIAHGVIAKFRNRNAGSSADNGCSDTSTHSRSRSLAGIGLDVFGGRADPSKSASNSCAASSILKIHPNNENLQRIPRSEIESSKKQKIEAAAKSTIFIANGDTEIKSALTTANRKNYCCPSVPVGASTKSSLPSRKGPIPLATSQAKSPALRCESLSRLSSSTIKQSLNYSQCHFNNCLFDCPTTKCCHVMSLSSRSGFNSM